MQNKVVLGFDFDANTVLTEWFCCNMSRSPLDIFSGANDARVLAAFFYGRGGIFELTDSTISWGGNV